MGNTTSSSRRHHHNNRRLPPPIPAPGLAPHPAQPPITTNQYVFAAPSQYPIPNLPPINGQYPPGYYPPPPVPVHNFHGYPDGGAAPHLPVAPYFEHQKAVTIRNDVNIKKESIRVEEDEENPGKFLVAFTFDAAAPGRMTVAFAAKEREDGNLIATKESLLRPVTVSFEQGLGQKFRQPLGTGISFSMFHETELKEDEEGVYPLVVKAEATPLNNDGSETSSTGNSQITLAVFDKKEGGQYLVRAMKQILWVNGKRYELQEIYGIGNSADVESDGNDSGKDCVICMSEPRDTTVLPCRHMCMCSRCAKELQFRTDKCPICRQPVERLLEIKVNNGTNY